MSRSLRIICVFRHSAGRIVRNNFEAGIVGAILQKARINQGCIDVSQLFHIVRSLVNTNELWFNCFFKLSSLRKIIGGKHSVFGNGTRYCPPLKRQSGWPFGSERSRSDCEPAQAQTQRHASSKAATPEAGVPSDAQSDRRGKHAVISDSQWNFSSSIAVSKFIGLLPQV